MGVNRLFLMVYLLLERGTMTAPELADYFEVSVRTIYRDIDQLSGAGIPVYATQGKGGGISIPDGFVLKKAFVSEQEQQQILMSLQGLAMIDTQDTGPVLEKLGSLFQNRNSDWIEIDFSDWNRNSDLNFQTLKEAIFQNRQVAFLYYGTQKEPSARTVNPLKLVFKSRSWYLFAHCCSCEEDRLFKLTRIKELCTASGTFTRPAEIPVMQKVTHHQQQLLTVRLLFHKNMGSRVYDHFDHITTAENGDFIVEADLPPGEYLYSFLLSFSSQMEVLDPPSVRKELARQLELMLNKYIT